MHRRGVDGDEILASYMERIATDAEQQRTDKVDLDQWPGGRREMAVDCESLALQRFLLSCLRRVTSPRCR